MLWHGLTCRRSRGPYLFWNTRHCPTFFLRIAQLTPPTPLTLIPQTLSTTIKKFMLTRKSFLIATASHMDSKSALSWLHPSEKNTKLENTTRRNRKSKRRSTFLSNGWKIKQLRHLRLLLALQTALENSRHELRAVLKKFSKKFWKKSEKIQRDSLTRLFRLQRLSRQAKTFLPIAKRL